MALDQQARAMGKSTVVIKFGGNALNQTSIKTFCDTLASLHNQEISPVIVHGGGPQINTLLGQLGIVPNFIDGLRYTDSETLSAAAMVLCGQVNLNLVTYLNQSGVLAVGINGVDGNTLLAEKLCFDEFGAPLDLGFVGQIIEVNTELITSLINQNFIPVIAPIAHSQEGQIYNINADYAAMSIAQSLKAEKLILMSNTAGLLDNNGQLITQVNAEKIAQLIAEKVITDGMIPKMKSAIDALSAVNTVHLIDAHDSSALTKCLSNSPTGTTITA